MARFKSSCQTTLIPPAFCSAKIILSNTTCIRIFCFLDKRYPLVHYHLFGEMYLCIFLGDTTGLVTQFLIFYHPGYSVCQSLYISIGHQYASAVGQQLCRTMWAVKRHAWQSAPHSLYQSQRKALVARRQYEQRSSLILSGHGLCGTCHFYIVIQLQPMHL